QDNFVGDVKHFARDNRLLELHVEVCRELDDGVGRDAGQNSGGERRSAQHAIVDEKNVHARAFADVTVGIERDAFGVAVEGRFHANELRVHVIRRGFGHGGESVGGDGGSGADADVELVGNT